MRYLAAYMLCQLGGKEHPTAADLKHILESVGIESDGERLKQLMSSLEGKDINNLIAEGSTKLSSVPMGGAPVAAVPAAGAAAAPAAAETAKTDSKPAKEAPKEESESEEDLGFGLFD